MEFVIISGLSGAGKSKAAEFLEDMGFYTVDNMPAELMPRFAELCRGGAGRYDRVALVIDVRAGDSFEPLFAALDELDAMEFGYKLLFMEASLPTIIKRYKETRRLHPLAGRGKSLEDVANDERKMLASVRARADYILDTTPFDTTAKLRAALTRLFGQGQPNSKMTVSVMSFGYKHGLPLEADLVLDVRFLPNPFYVPELKPLTGLDAPIQAFLDRYEVTGQFLDKVRSLLDFLLPLYEEEGKKNLTVAVGCTGGQHRSVAVAHALAEHLQGKEYPVTEYHRDMPKEGA